MAGFDPDVFGGSQGFDPDVFGAAPTKKPLTPRGGVSAQIANDAISQGARAFPSEGISGSILNALGGGVKGATDIGTTLMDLANRKLAQPALQAVPDRFRLQTDAVPTRQETTAGIDAGLQSLGADPDSLLFKGGRLATQIAGTAGVGGAMAAPIRALGAGPTANAIATALETGGFRAPGLSGIPAFATRVGAGGLVGGASAGLTDPDLAGTGAVIGAALPPALQLAGKAGQALGDAMQSGSRKLMQSAIKPTIAQLKSGDAATAIDTMLQRGISPNASGVEKLQSLIDQTDNNISSAISGSTAQIDKAKVLQALNQTRSQFTNQVAPQADLGAIQAAQDAFLAHPSFPGQAIPVQDAQALKQGTYRVLAKKYGQLGSADTEAQKAIARGLKDEIAAAVPGVSDANAELSRLLTTLDVAQRRALMEGNKNPLGLAAIAPSKAGLLGFLADRSAQLKSLGARGLYSASGLPGAGIGLLDNPALLPYMRAGLLATEANP